MSNIADAKANALKIISYIKEGMSELDAVILADMSEQEYLDIRRLFPKVAVIIDKAKIEYKHKIISKMNRLAADGDIKAINWVAENSPSLSEYGKKKGAPGGEVNPLAEAFRFIQENSKPPVKSSKK